MPNTAIILVVILCPVILMLIHMVSTQRKACQTLENEVNAMNERVLAHLKASLNPSTECVTEPTLTQDEQVQPEPTQATPTQNTHQTHPLNA